jgi:hypothetical protein
MVEGQQDIIRTQVLADNPAIALQNERSAELGRRSPGAGQVEQRYAERIIPHKVEDGEEGEPTETQLQSRGDVQKMLAKGAVSPAGRKLLEAMGIVKENQDPKEALSKSEPAFQDSIKEADAAVKAINDRAAELTKLPKEQLQAQLAAVPQADFALARAIAHVEVPARQKDKISQEDLQEKVKSEVDAWMKTKPGDLAYRGLEADLKQYPQVWEAAQAARAANEAEPLHTLAGMIKQYGRATADSVETRLAYADALKAGGREDDAWEQFKTAMKMLGQKVPEDRPGTLRASFDGTHTMKI